MLRRFDHKNKMDATNVSYIDKRDCINSNRNFPVRIQN